MAKKLYAVVGFNAYGNSVILFSGTLTECLEYYKSHEGLCESLEAMIQDK